jgi:hypothetical protein
VSPEMQRCAAPLVCPSVSKEYISFTLNDLLVQEEASNHAHYKITLFDTHVSYLCRKGELFPTTQKLY